MFNLLNLDYVNLGIHYIPYEQLKKIGIGFDRYKKKLISFLVSINNFLSNINDI